MQEDLQNIFNNEDGGGGAGAVHGGGGRRQPRGVRAGGARGVREEEQQIPGAPGAEH